MEKGPVSSVNSFLSYTRRLCFHSQILSEHMGFFLMFTVCEYIGRMKKMFKSKTYIMELRDHRNSETDLVEMYEIIVQLYDPLVYEEETKTHMCYFIHLKHS